MKIEKGIPVPGRRLGVYPFDAMDIGDCLTAQTPEEFSKMNKAALNYGGYHKKKFTGRAKHLRVWRIA